MSAANKTPVESTASGEYNENKNFFPPKPEAHPTVYAYIDKFDINCKGLIKIGYTTRDAETRVKEQYSLLRPGEKHYEILLSETSMRNDGSSFTDKDIHRYLRASGVANPQGEWFACSVNDIKAAIIAVKDGAVNAQKRTLNFAMRPEQVQAVEKTAEYFKNYSAENPHKTPHFLWNAKMRFGKTFAAYRLAKRMGYKKILVITFKPAVVSAWEEDLTSHVDFEGWQFICKGGLTYDCADKSKPIVCFGSFQDFLGKNEAGGIKPKNEWVHATNWDLVILDEYHFGAWRESAKDLFEEEDKQERAYALGEHIEDYDEELMPITTNAYLYLSGTPFRAIASGEFIEEQIYNWTYSDEQRAKENWTGGDNPYRCLPRMVLMTYQLPDAVKEIASQGQFNEFDLGEFFAASDKTDKSGRYKFKHEEEVQKWLDLIRGSLAQTLGDNLALGAKKPPLPFSDIRLLNVLSHTLWFLPSVASCYAMRGLLAQKQNTFYKDYKVIVAAGPSAGIGAQALKPVKEAMANPLESKTITLSCGKLTTGVTIRPWAGIFMLRNLSTPETYFQAAFRVQSPWVISDYKEDTIIKNECYVFDFAPERALRQIADYGCRLNVEETNPEQKIAEFINFLPVLAYDGSSMKQLNASGILDVAMSGTSATLLARRWESALLVNVDNNTLKRLMESEEAMRALMSIEGFRNLSQEIETIINKSEHIKKIKKGANDNTLSDREKRELTKEEKEYKSKRKAIQEKLIKFATRIPVFMYLTDFRERTLKDVITELEPYLFKKVTGIDVKDFHLLLSLGVFNSSLMNDAIYKFKRYEDASLSYTGIAKHEDENIGLWDTAITRCEFYGLTGV